MSGYRKSKGLALELTSLLDVIMIMLFWVMTNSSASAADAQDKADKKVKAAQTKIEQSEKKLEDQAKEYDKKIEELKAQALEQQAKINENAAMNQQAINDYKDGLLITLTVKNNDGNAAVTVSQGNDTLSDYSISDDLYDSLGPALETLGINDGKTALAAVVYDGDTVLYDDISLVRDAVSKISQAHNNVYFTYINTSK